MPCVSGVVSRRTDEYMSKQAQAVRLRSGTDRNILVHPHHRLRSPCTAAPARYEKAGEGRGGFARPFAISVASINRPLRRFDGKDQRPSSPRQPSRHQARNKDFLALAAFCDGPVRRHLEARGHGRRPLVESLLGSLRPHQTAMTHQHMTTVTASTPVTEAQHTRIHVIPVHVRLLNRRGRRSERLLPDASISGATPPPTIARISSISTATVFSDMVSTCTLQLTLDPRRKLESPQMPLPALEAMTPPPLEMCDNSSQGARSHGMEPAWCGRVIDNSPPR
ncbi:hypothetical protein DCS_03219 [Drechmeria coniospora]|uniref:Uncharacterized protein n=1 Tax=Drechmeria coniospora TaxID=98403 RepID=A0A151GY96_DRECN|nr:hypothetical protein DCS_03219 [Drechmeria coniospora]KYK62074.1 hypothetical protein DCS_03219 [Drechmeria coniospora]